MAFYRCGGGLPTQQKNNEVAKTTNLVVTPDDGYVLEKVTVAPTPSEPGSATAPLSGSVEYPAPSGKYFNKFTVTATPSTSSYEITAGTSDKTITPPSGSLISGGTVHPTPSYQGTGTAPITGTSSAITPTSGNHFSSFKITATPSVSDYSITAGTTSKAITHPTGKLIFGGTVNPTPTEKGSDTAPVSGTKECTPTEGKFFSDFTISAPPTETISVTAGTTDIPFTARPGTLISGGTFHPTPTESLEVTAPLTGSRPYEPHEGKFFSDATIFASPSVTNYEITASTSDKSITLPSGGLIAGGTVHATPSYVGSETALTTEKTYTPTTGKFFSKFTIIPQKHTDTTPVAITTRTSSYDLGSIHNKRYINTDGVPNSHSGTRSTAITTNTSSLDLGADHTFRYVNVNVARGTDSTYNGWNTLWEGNAGQGRINFTKSWSTAVSGYYRIMKIEYVLSESDNTLANIYITDFDRTYIIFGTYNGSSYARKIATYSNENYLDVDYAYRFPGSVSDDARVKVKGIYEAQVRADFLEIIEA